MHDLNQFMVEIGKPLNKIPIMGYKELDLYQLFQEVIAYGGFNEVVKNVGTWSKIWKRLGNFDPSITDSSFRLKKNYERYLLEFEYKTFPEHKQQAIDFERQLQLKRNASQVLIEALTNSNPSTPTTPTGSAPSSPNILNLNNGSSLPTPLVASASPLNNMGSQHKKHRRSKTPCIRDIVRDKSGNPRLPLNLGELTLISLGTIIPRAPYVTLNHIWPIGFSSTRYFTSMRNPSQRVQYVSQIVDAGDRPQFVVTVADDPSNPIISHSPSGCWRTVLKRVMGKIGSEEAQKNISVSGSMRFGLAHPVIAHLIRELPRADLCLDIDFSNNTTESDESPQPRNKQHQQYENKKRSSSDSSSEERDDDFAAKFAKLEGYSTTATMTTRTPLFQTREELEDLESAVATLQALKYCAVY